ncbi:hypothetical protein PC128_g7711 [Phytophthora cactorum]|nr:hypothetical protein PC120_g5962 [Phytophthora cactorum]KAG3077121.1 hypothetical protein PC121_g7515 [Phytophthora cactorum]KAG3196362.1 hypothetical protein PC128_g7711 [Phytophthora cactorum]KAG4055886.1 hypothetical protein PC123_g9045 [Phytophthora cactorum]
MRRNQSFERQQFAETRLPKKEQNAARSGSVVEDTSSTSSDKRQRLIREYFDNVFSEDELEELEHLLV